MHANFWYAITLSGLAAGATAAGSLVSLAVRRPGPGFMAFSLGFSAGVMMLVSFVELLRVSIAGIGFPPAMVAFFAGMGVMFAIDLAVPHEFVTEHGASGRRPEEVSALLRTGLLLAVGIGIHNLPEGMATFAGALESRSLGVVIAAAIALHNIPEGISVSVPIFYATGDRKKAFRLSFLSGLAEPAGAVIGYLVLLPFLTHTLLASLMAFVAGIMVYISVDELLPLAHRYGRGHAVIAGITLGMAIMAATILMLAPA